MGQTLRQAKDCARASAAHEMYSLGAPLLAVGSSQHAKNLRHIIRIMEDGFQPSLERQNRIWSPTACGGIASYESSV